MYVCMYICTTGQIRGYDIVICVRLLGVTSFPGRPPVTQAAELRPPPPPPPIKHVALDTPPSQINRRNRLLPRCVTRNDFSCATANRFRVNCYIDYQIDTYLCIYIYIYIYIYI